MAKQHTKTYQQMSEELAGYIEWFEGEPADLDEAIVKYEQAMKLLAKMESYLKAAQNKIKKINAQFE